VQYFELQGVGVSLQLTTSKHCSYPTYLLYTEDFVINVALCLDIHWAVSEASTAETCWTY